MAKRAARVEMLLKLVGTPAEVREACKLVLEVVQHNARHSRLARLGVWSGGPDVDPGNDFNNQLTYQWLEPIDFKPGDTLEYACTWDNSTGDAVVKYGERTDEEMCYFFTIVGP